MATTHVNDRYDAYATYKGADFFEERDGRGFPLPGTAQPTDIFNKVDRVQGASMIQGHTLSRNTHNKPGNCHERGNRDKAAVLNTSIQDNSVLPSM